MGRGSRGAREASSPAGASSSAPRDFCNELVDDGEHRLDSVRSRVGAVKREEVRCDDSAKAVGADGGPSSDETLLDAAQGHDPGLGDAFGNRGGGEQVVDVELQQCEQQQSDDEKRKDDWAVDADGWQGAQGGAAKGGVQGVFETHDGKVWQVVEGHDGLEIVGCAGKVEAGGPYQRKQQRNKTRHDVHDCRWWWRGAAGQEVAFGTRV